jgi:hypothetical protein
MITAQEFAQDVWEELLMTPQKDAFNVIFNETGQAMYI